MRNYPANTLPAPVPQRNAYGNPVAYKRSPPSAPTFANATAHNTRVTQPTGLAPRPVGPCMPPVARGSLTPNTTVVYSSTHHTSAPLTQVKQRMLANALTRMFTSFHVAAQASKLAAAQRARVLAKRA
jgi:hypothetical protein